MTDRSSHELTLNYRYMLVIYLLVYYKNNKKKYNEIKIKKKFSVVSVFRFQKETLLYYCLNFKMK